MSPRLTRRKAVLNQIKHRAEIPPWPCQLTTLPWQSLGCRLALQHSEPLKAERTSEHWNIFKQICFKDITVGRNQAFKSGPGRPF